MYGDSYGSPGQDSHFDPSSPGALEDGTAAQGTATAAPELPPTDVKVAGPPKRALGQGRAWSEPEVAEVDDLPVGHRARQPRSNGRLKYVAMAAAAAVVVGGGAVAVLAMTGGDGKGRAADAALPPSAQSADPVASASLQAAADDQARKTLENRASLAAQAAATDKPKVVAKGAGPSPSASASAATGGGGSDPMPAGQAQAYAKSRMGAFGFTASGQFSCLVNLWNKESHWNVHAGNASGAYGIPQALPGSKMGAGWQDDAKVQINWGLGYIKNRWSTPCGAWAHSQSSGWY